MAAHELIQKLDDAETNNGKKAKNVDTREKRKAADAEDVEKAVRRGGQPTPHLAQLADHTCVIMTGGAVSSVTRGVLRRTRAMVQGKASASHMYSGARGLCARALGGRAV